MANPKEPKDLKDLSLTDAYRAFIPAGNGMRYLGSDVAKYGPDKAGDMLKTVALETGEAKTVQEAMRYAAGQLDNLERYLRGVELERMAHKRLQAQARKERRGRGGDEPLPA